MKVVILMALAIVAVLGLWYYGNYRTETPTVGQIEQDQQHRATQS